jgi:hypothetical protein
MSLKREKLEDWSLRSMMGKRAPTNGENSPDYEALRAAIEQHVDPQNIFDEIRAQEIADKFWEEQRLRRYQRALILGAVVPSLASLLAPYYGENLEEALETARNFYSGDPDKTRRSRKIIDQYGITPEQIEANAMQVQIPGVHLIDRMITSRESYRNRLMKEDERRKRRAEKARRQAAVNDNGPHKRI